MSAASVRLILTRKKFRAWLEKQPSGKVVGHTDRPGSCPLATFVSTQWGGIPVRVCGDIQVNLRRPEPLPRWAANFVARVDLIPRGTSRRLGLPVTREDALRYLQEVRS